MPYCATGELDLGLKWVVDFDTYIFDVFDPTKTVLFGLNATINKGIPEFLEVRTGGCAAPVLVDLSPKFLPHLLEAAVKFCTWGGGPGKYNPRTESYSAEFNISAQLSLFSGGRKISQGIQVNGTANAWIKPHFDIGLDAHVIDTVGDPNILQSSLIFLNSMATVNGSIFTWRIINGISLDMYSTGTGHHYFNRTFINKIIQVSPPQVRF